MTITLDTPTTLNRIATANDEPVSELALIKVEEDYARNEVFAILWAHDARFRILLWRGPELDDLNARAEQWTDEDVVARIKEVLS
jgi:hypothetical protein